MTSLYLAGPDVFLEDAAAIGARKVELCAAYGFEGLFPLDAEPEFHAHLRPSRAIYEANIALIGRSAGVIANLTPFRGVSADPGTLFELAYAIAKALPVFAYSNVAEPFAARLSASFGSAGRHDALGRTIAGDGMTIEDFEQPGAPLSDNLMIEEAVRAQGWDIVTRDVAPAERFRDLGGFEACLALARARLGIVTGESPQGGAGKRGAVA